MLIRARKTTTQYTNVFNTVETREVYIIRPFVDKSFHLVLYTKLFEMSSIFKYLK